MPDGTRRRGDGEVFDRVAVAYDRHRPTYPDELIDLACRIGGLERGDEVLEVGCGTGQLTGRLLERGLRVTAVEPGVRLVRLARQRLRDAGELELVNTRLEDARLPHGRFRAVFSATAIHWVDPDVGWQRMADALRPGGMLALIQHFGLHDPCSTDDQEALLSAMTAVAPDVAASWPRHRDLESIIAGFTERRGNVSEAWSWLSDHQLAREDAARLFDEARISAAPTLLEHTAAELNALLGTMSFWARLSPEQRQALEGSNVALYDRLGRPIRSSVVACLVTARRVGTADGSGMASA